MSLENAMLSDVPVVRLNESRGCEIKTELAWIGWQ